MNETSRLHANPSRQLKIKIRKLINIDGKILAICL